MSYTIEQFAAELAPVLVQASTRRNRKSTAPAQLAAAKLAEQQRADREAAAAEQAERDAQRAAARNWVRFDRLHELGELMAAAKHDAAAAELSGDTAAAADAASRIDAVRAEQGMLYGQPIDPQDLAPNGRFIKSINYHNRRVGLMAADAVDVLGEALALAYLPGHADDLTPVTVGYARPRAFGPQLEGQLQRGEAIVELWPTLGATYRNVKSAQRWLIDRSRRMISQGRIAEFSLDALLAAGIDPEDRYARAGFDYVDSHALDEASYHPVQGAASTRSELALADLARENQRRVIEADKRKAERLARLGEASPASGTSDKLAASWRVDAMLVNGVVRGLAVRDVAAAVGITPAATERRLNGFELAGNVSQPDAIPAPQNGVQRPRVTSGHVRATVTPELAALADKGRRNDHATYATPVRVGSVA